MYHIENDLLAPFGLSMQDVIEKPILIPGYRETLERYKSVLVEGYPVPDDVGVSIIGNNTLLETTFRLRKMDREPIGLVRNPGKSAHVTFTRVTALSVLAQLGRPSKREDRLYIVPAALFRQVRFSPNYAPTAHRKLHVRLVPYRLDDGDIPQEDRVNLVQLIQQFQVQKS